MIKVFISQPMKGKTDEEILKERQAAVEMVKETIDKYFNDVEVQVIDSFFQGAPADAKPLWFLGKSLELLSTADMAVFAPGWDQARGCKIEHECAVQYGIKTLYLEG